MVNKEKREFLSIIIPTLDEADFLGYLLFSLSRQTYKNFEVIVSDGSSKDQTLEIAESFRTVLPSLKIVVSKERSPAKQRNEGVNLAIYEKLLFLDADVILPSEFLEENLKELAKKNLRLAGPSYLPIGGKISDQYINTVTKWGIRALKDIFPIGLSWALFSTKTIHSKINGFDEKMRKISEDGDYIFRAVKTGEKFNLLRNCPGFVSMRRYEANGRTRELMSTLRAWLLISLLGRHKAQKLIKRSYGKLKLSTKKNIRKRKKNGFLDKEVSELLKDLADGLKKNLEDKSGGRNG